MNSFEIICKKCGGKDIKIIASDKYSENDEEGSIDIEFQCNDCGESEIA